MTTSITYDWKRYWVPREGGFSFDSQGFLLPPARDAEWAKYWKTDVVGIEELLTKPCLVLLGEPGIGKSFAIRDVEEQTRKARLGAKAMILARDLSSYSTDSLLVEDVFNSREFLSWQQNDGALHMFLDSFDECLLRVDAVAELLAARFTRLSSVHNLFLRIASRTAEWPTSLEDALREKWGKDSVAAYELAPLTREQVSQAAQVHLTDSERFIQEVVQTEVVSFAIKPLTLELLLRVWKARGGSLPPTQREIYEQGCLELCADSEKRQAPKLRRQLSPEQRLAVASHVAAATFFCNRPAVWTAPSQAQKPEADISLSELATGCVTVKDQRLAVNESLVREALDTGLFTSRGRNRLGCAHQTYGEFLAARYLVQERLSVRQTLDLLTHPEDPDRKLIPQLQETAAWAAVPGSELFAHLIRVQPDVLLRSDVATADAKDKSALVEALISAFAQDSVHSDWWAMRNRFRKLCHRGLAKQLRRHLMNRNLAADARIEAIAMAEACELNKLLPFLTRLALNTSEILSVRERAATAVAKSVSAELKRRLRPLALGQAGPDPRDDLRGAGLTACWPEHLAAGEIFSSLKEPDARFHGLYHSFLSHGLVEKLTALDLPTALAWAESQPEQRGSFDGGYAGLLSRILDRAAEHIEEAGVLTSLATALLSRLRKHGFSCGRSPSRLIRMLETRPDLRLKLVDAMVPFFGDAKCDSMLVTRWGLRLLFPQDLPWLIERLHSAPSPELQKHFAHLLSWGFYPEDPGQIDAVIEAAKRCPVLLEVMPLWLKPMTIDSDEARRARELYLDEQHHRKEVEKQREPKLLSPPPGERLVMMLDQFEAGDVDAWWKLHIWLEVEDNGHWCEKHYHMDIRELAGWKNATDTTKARMVAAAERYVCGRGANPEEWFSRPNITYHPAVAGFRALLLLANENASAFEALPCEVWRRWAPAILRPHYYDELDEHRLLSAKAFDRAPNEAVAWTLKVVNEESKEGENIWVLSKLPTRWNESLGVALLQLVKQGRLKPRCFDYLLTALLKAGVPGALNFTRLQIPRKVPTSAKRCQPILYATRLLMLHGERGDWSRVWNLVSMDTGFGKKLVEGFSHDYAHSPAGILKTLSEADVSALWEWILAQYPIAEDPDRSRGGTVTIRHAMANLRDSLISYLADVGTAAGCRELRRLIAKYPEFAWFRRTLLRGQEQVRRLTWRPASPTGLFQLAGNRRARFVQSGDQLLETIMDSLEVLQQRLKGETLLAQFLWDGKRPKPEEAISDWVKVHLEDDLKQRGVVLGREVQIHRFDRTDIHVTAVTRGRADELFGNVKVIIEVKGCWHPKLKSAMQHQLAERYLADNDCHNGLYLVGWFPFGSWSKRNKRGKKAHFPDRKALEAYLTNQAKALSKPGQTIRSAVIDFSMRTPAAKQQPTPTLRKLSRRNSEARSRQRTGRSK
jgi:hypothetical protein